MFAAFLALAYFELPLPVVKRATTCVGTGAYHSQQSKSNSTICSRPFATGLRIVSRIRSRVSVQIQRTKLQTLLNMFIARSEYGELVLSPIRTSHTNTQARSWDKVRPSAFNLDITEALTSIKHILPRRPTISSRILP